MRMVKDDRKSIPYAREGLGARCVAREGPGP
jgi:hypothetical protein